MKHAVPDAAQFDAEALSVDWSRHHLMLPWSLGVAGQARFLRANVHMNAALSCTPFLL